MKTNEDYKLMTTYELIEAKRILTEKFWRICNEDTTNDSYIVHEKTTDVLEAISDQIHIIDGLII